MTMKNAIKFFAAFALITIALSSCSTTKGAGYQNHLRNKNNGCLLSDYGCGWANAGKH
jgi:outer membrane protein assembly factor BamE (lipoprotein component of BamABCDE complex)